MILIIIWIIHNIYIINKIILFNNNNNNNAINVNI